MPADPFQPGYQVTDPLAPLGTQANPGVGSQYQPQGLGFGWAPYGTPTTPQYQEQAREQGELIFNQGLMNNYMEQYLNTNASMNFENQFAAFETGYKRQNIGFDRAGAQLQGDLLSNQMNQSNANYGVTQRGLAVDRGGITRDIGTENQLQALRDAGFGLDRESLGLQGKRLDLQDEQIGQNEREQRHAYGDQIFNEDARAAQSGSTVSEGHRRALSSLAQQLAFQLEGNNRDRSGVMLGRGDVDISGRRVGLEQQGAGVQHTSALGKLSDQMAGNALAGEKAWNDMRFGNNATWIGQQGVQNDLGRLGAADTYNTQSLGYTQQRNQLRAAQDIRNLAIDAHNATGGKTGFDFTRKDPFAA